jgi:hypothetical protein
MAMGTAALALDDASVMGGGVMGARTSVDVVTGTGEATATGVASAVAMALQATGMGDAEASSRFSLLI